MRRFAVLSSMLLAAGLLTVWGCGLNTMSAPTSAAKSPCVGCHKEANPGLVKDHLDSRMGMAGVDCAACHGSGHTDAASSDKAQLPGVQTCGKCHPEQTEQFMGGKHALGWAAMAALPVTAMQPKAAIEGLKGCGGCHKVGIQDPKSPVQSRYGMGCNSCHTRHKFSKAEARRPRSCNPCHQAASYIQWEAWSKSKHGVIYAIEGDSGRAPTCQTCHMQQGDHSVITAWGELALLIDNHDPEWAGYREAIFKYLHAYDPQGHPTPGLDGVLAAKMMRSSPEQWAAEREKMTVTCTRCHGRTFAKTHLQNTDRLLKEADGKVAQAIETVADLYRRGILRADEGQMSYPNIGLLYEAPTPIEQELYHMLIVERGVTVHAAFHQNPVYVTEGQAGLQKSLLDIQQQAKEMIRQAESQP